MEGPKKAAIASAFKKFDINGDGTISEEELRRVMMALDPSLSHSDLEIIFSGADLSKDGAVSLEEFATWAAEPQGMFGMVPANAANALTREEQAALRIQSLARGRAGRKRVKSEKKVAPVAVAPVVQVEPISRVELWEGLAFDRGRIRPKIDVFELVSGFNGCKRTGLSPVVADVLAADGNASFDMLPEQVNHLALMICGSREPLSEIEAREEMLKMKALVQACDGAIRSEEKMALRHFKNWCTLLAHLMQLDLSVIILQWYWFEFGLFLPTVEVAEVLLMSTVYSEQRLKALASRNDMELGDLKGKLLSLPFNLRDLMQLVYNGGLCGRPDCHCLLPSEVEALWPYLLRTMPRMVSQRESLRRGVAMGNPRKEELDRDVRKDLEKSHLLGLEELSILLEQLYDNDKMKSRFPSPLEMVCGMVKHSEQCGRLWDDSFVEPSTRSRRKVDEYSEDYSDYYSDEYTRSGRTVSRSISSSRTFSIGDLSRSSRSPARSDRLRRKGRPRSVADSEDYHELKDYLDKDEPFQAPSCERRCSPRRERLRTGKNRRRSPLEKPRKRKRVELVPNKTKDTKDTKDTKADGEVQRVRLECRKAKELARKAQAECLEAKEESRRLLEESRLAKEESERIKEQIRNWSQQHWEEEEEEDWNSWESEWPRPDEVKWARSHPKATLISAERSQRSRTQTHEKAAWWHGAASWASHAKAWARDAVPPRSARAKLTNADVRNAAKASVSGTGEAAKEMRMLVKNIKTTKLRREFQKRVGGQFGSYKKHRDERRAGRESRKTTDPYSVLFAHLSRRVPEDYLKSLFQEIGPIEHFELWKGPDGQSVGRGKVTFSSTAHANSAVKQLSGWYVHGRTMRVCLWRPVTEEFGQPHKENKLPEKPCSVTFSNCNAVSTEGFLRWLLSKAGTVLCFALQRSDEGKSLGWGSCTFDSKDAAERAVQRFDGAWVDNRQIKLEVDLKPPKSFRPCVFFHNVSWTTTAHDLKRRLQQFGTIEEFELRVKPNGRSLGMGTCRFACSKEAKAAIKGLDGHMLQGRRLYLCRYDPIGAGRVQASRPWENCPPEVKEEVVSDEEKEESNPSSN